MNSDDGESGIDFRQLSEYRTDVGAPDAGYQPMKLDGSSSSFDQMFKSLSAAIQVQRQSLMDFLYDLRIQVDSATHDQMKELLADMFIASAREVSAPANNRQGIIRNLKGELRGYLDYIEADCPRSTTEDGYKSQAAAMSVWATPAERRAAANESVDRLHREIQSQEAWVAEAKRLSCYVDYTPLHDLFTTASKEGVLVDRHQVMVLAGYFTKLYIGLCESLGAGWRLLHTQHTMSRIPQGLTEGEVSRIRRLQGGGRRSSGSGDDYTEDY